MKKNLDFLKIEIYIKKKVKWLEALHLADAQSTGLGWCGRRRKLLLDGAVHLSSKMWQHITTVRFVLAFIIVSTGKPNNAYQWV